MPPQFFDFLSSKTFEVQSRDKSFTVHSDILTAQSEPLRRIIGVWKEGAEKKIKFSAWDGNTVGRFLQFLYIGDYQVSGSISEGRDVEGNGGAAEEEGEDSEWGRWGRGMGRGGINTLDAGSSMADQGQFRTKGDTNTLLAHLKVYALAKDKGVEALRTMAFRRLKEDDIFKGAFEATATATANVIEMLEYVCSHIGFQMNPDDPMRLFLLLFAVENIGVVMDRGRIARDVSDFPVKLVEEIAGMLCDEREKTCALEMEVQNLRNRAVASNQKMWLLEDKVDWLERSCPSSMRNSDGQVRYEDWMAESILSPESQIRFS